MWLPRIAGLQSWHVGQQPPGIWVLRIGQHLLNRPLLDHQVARDHGPLHMPTRELVRPRVAQHVADGIELVERRERVLETTLHVLPVDSEVVAAVEPRHILR
ncbi:MAG TPA: hypothetical protein VFU22_28385, partial [Roseiflexaceae bacterium]|nr:hypothetical protein [Roseiflexaceae bacterium]